MFGVRIMSDGEVAELKIFGILAAAKEQFQRCRDQICDGYFDSIAIFNVVDTNDVREAASAIRNGNKDRIVLVDLQESWDLKIAKLAKKITITL